MNNSSKKNAQTKRDSFENNLIGSKRKPGLIESDRGKEFYKNIFQDFLNKNNIKLYSRDTSLSAVFAERFNRTIRDLPKEIVFEQGDANKIDVLTTITKQYNNRAHTSTKLSPKDAPLKKNERFVYKKIIRQTEAGEGKTKASSKRCCQNNRFKQNVFKRRYD